jgi:hypothetical protein
LSKFLLSQLQQIEKQFDSTVTSSLAVAHSIDDINRRHVITNETQLATIDVESLFTRIPQDRLLDIVNHLFTESNLLDKEYQPKFMQYLKNIIKFNTFQVAEKTYLQQIGLPMGGPLSGTLANIYLGHLERNIRAIEHIKLYKRYMDDILVVANLTSSALEKFLTQLRKTLDLTLTASSNRLSVNFLDTTITINRLQKSLEIWPFTKNYTCYPIPSLLGKKSFGNNANIVTSQILRTWRFSTSSREFSKSINQYLPFLTQHRHHRQLRRRVFQFLRPVKLSTHKWTTSIPVCNQCVRTSELKEIQISKIFKLGKDYIAIRKPMNCKTVNIHIIMRSAKKENSIIAASSLHEFLHADRCEQSALITPLGQISNSSLQRLLQKHNGIQYEGEPTKKKSRPCYVYNIFKNPQQLYGVPTTNRRTKTVGNFINFYKKISRKIR